jgi:hypothetical protein
VKTFDATELIKSSRIMIVMCMFSDLLNSEYLGVYIGKYTNGTFGTKDAMTMISETGPFSLQPAAGLLLPWSLPRSLPYSLLEPCMLDTTSPLLADSQLF